MGWVYVTKSVAVEGGGGQLEEGEEEEESWYDSVNLEHVHYQENEEGLYIMQL